MKKLLLATAVLAGMSVNVLAYNCEIDYTDSSGNLVSIRHDGDCTEHETPSGGGSVSEGDLDDTFATDADLIQEVSDLKNLIKTVDIEDQRLVSTTLGDDNTLTLTTTDMDGESPRDVTVDLSSLDQSHEIQDLTGGVDDNTTNISTNTEAITNLNSFKDQQLMFNESLSQSINSNSNRISTLETKTKQLTKGVAMAGALAMGAGLHTIDHDGRFTLIPSVVSYDGETALAIQTQIAFNNHMSIRLGYSNTANDFISVKDGMVGGAATFSF